MKNNQLDPRFPEFIPPITSHKAWYVFAVLIFVLLGIGSPIFGVFEFISLLSEGERFEGPGKHTFKVEEPGSFTLWLETQGIHNGGVFSFSDELPEGTKISVYKEGTNEKLSFESGFGASESGSSGSRSSIGDFEVENLGNYTVVIEGEFGKRIFMVRRSILSKILGLFGLIFVTSVLGWIGPAIIVFVVYRKRKKCKEEIETSFQKGYTR